MSADAEPMAETSAPRALPWPRLFWWSVRREIWEHRAVYLAPMAAAGLGVFGVLISSLHIPPAVRAAMADPKKAEALIMPYAVVAFAVLITGFVFAAFYSIGALHNERRDRSVLFWKSLPVSNLIVVLSKAAIPAIVLPLAMFVSACAGQILVLILSSLIVAVNGLNPMELWSRIDLPFMWAAFGRGLVFMPLWFAPVIAWLMLVSGWARRMPILWAVAPLIAAEVIEHLFFGKQGGPLSALLLHRFGGWYHEIFSVDGKGKIPVDKLADLDPSRFLSSPQVWAGLVLAAVFLAVAVRVRRSADPI